jgi:aspartyl-tRNA(Asn)/glutamyl-tRNA(Gln) amidotransferase subunit B
MKRFGEEYNLPVSDVEVLTQEKVLAAYFEEVASEIQEKVSCGEVAVPIEKALKLAANYIITELRKHIGNSEEGLKNIKITPENYTELVGLVACGTINSSAAQVVLEEMYRTGGDPSQIITEKNLAQTSDAGELEKIVENILASNQQSVNDYKAGKENALKFLIGQVMKESKGKANPQVVEEILKKKLV